MTNYNIDAMLENMAEQIQRKQQAQSIKDPLMIGIHTGGVWVANRLHEMLGLTSSLGTLNISFYRDDFTRIGMHPQVLPSSMKENVEDRHIILVDDVLFTGRTIRAALNEIFDYGRPRNICLAVLVERDGRELPIQADIVGEHMKLAKDQHIKLTGPTPLNLILSGGNARDELPAEYSTNS